MKIKNFGHKYTLPLEEYYMLRDLHGPDALAALAFAEFCETRINGVKDIRSVQLPPYDANTDHRRLMGWERRDEGCVGNDGNDVQLVYFPAEDVLLAVEKLDLEYITRLKQEGNLLEIEPNLERDFEKYQEPESSEHRYNTHQAEIMELLQQVILIFLLKNHLNLRLHERDGR